VFDPALAARSAGATPPGPAWRVEHWWGVGEASELVEVGDGPQQGVTLTVESQGDLAGQRPGGGLGCRAVLDARDLAAQFAGAVAVGGGLGLIGRESLEDEVGTAGPGQVEFAQTGAVERRIVAEVGGHTRDRADEECGGEEVRAGPAVPGTVDAMEFGTGQYETKYGTVRFVVPSDEELEAAARHALTLWLLEGGDDVEYEEEEQLADVDVESDHMIHRIWWLTSPTCASFEECRCGRITLVELLDLTEDPVLRNEMMTMHMTEMVAAYAHYWAGDAAARDATRLLEAVCADCLIHGEHHVEVVGGEANTLAEEMGAALAVYQFSLGIGERRIPRPS
jgi:hypothetical protein